MKAIVIGVLMVGSAAHAECLDGAARAKAEALIEKAPSIVEFCERCGDKAPGAPVKALVRDRSRPEIDYASVYVATSSHRYENVAALVGCAERGVSPTLRVDDATATGVMIVADSAPVSRSEAIAQPPAAEVAAAPAIVPVPSFTVIDHAETSLWPLVLAGSSGVLFAAGMLALASRARRRRALRPRAANLVARE